MQISFLFPVSNHKPHTKYIKHLFNAFAIMRHVEL